MSAMSLRGVLLLLLCWLSTSHSACTSGFVLFAGKCYSPLQLPADFPSSLIWCSSHFGAAVFSPNSREENAVAKGLLAPGGSAWTGVQLSNGKWVNAGQELNVTLQAENFAQVLGQAPWAPNQPSPDSSQCVAVDSQGRWLYTPCTQLNAFFCEYIDGESSPALQQIIVQRGKQEAVMARASNISASIDSTANQLNQSIDREASLSIALINANADSLGILLDSQQNATKTLLTDKRMEMQSILTTQMANSSNPVRDQETLNWLNGSWRLGAATLALCIIPFLATLAGLALLATALSRLQRLLRPPKLYHSDSSIYDDDYDDLPPPHFMHHAIPPPYAPSPY